jgi:hypothetical protein
MLRNLYIPFKLTLYILRQVFDTISYCVGRENESFIILLFIGAECFSCLKYTLLYKLTIRKWYQYFLNNCDKEKLA